MACQKEEILKYCPCTSPDCDKKGKCCECLKSHLANNELPACCFPKDVEQNHDRSIDLFCQINLK